MRNTFLGFLFSMVISFSLIGQEGTITNHIYEGNTRVEEEAYTKAEKAYRKALSLAPEQPDALYNLGNTHYRDKQLDEASQRFFQTQKFATEKTDKHKAFHNMGNVFMQKKEYEKAVEAYKNALRNNPADEETRYNYALAKELLEKEQQQQDQDQDQDQDQKDDQEKKDKEEDQEQDGDQEKEDQKDDPEEGDEGDEKEKESDPEKEGDDPKDEKPKDQKEGDKEPSDKKEPPKPRPGQLSPEQVKSLLEAMNNQEKKVQDKVNAEKVKGVPLRGKKDW